MSLISGDEFNQSIQRCWANLCVTASYFETGKLSALRSNSQECSHEIRTGKQNVHANKVHAGMERQKIYIRACKVSGLQVSGLLCPSL